MIGTALIGGLGNQMYQYAAGRALALRHATDLALDLSSFAKPAVGTVPRSFELNRLSIDVASHDRRRDLSFLLARRRQRILRRMSGWHTHRETDLGYDPAIEHADDDTYLLGYWQSWRYFDAHRARIAADFQPRAPLSSRNLAVQGTMKATPSVALHVRRGDYLHSAHDSHGSLAPDFYVRAIERIRLIEPEPDIFVFSDDLEWCRTAFASLGWRMTFVDWNRGGDSWQDMFLMSACRHAVIANSSFSWWGAWLGDRRAEGPRTVVAPERWFADAAIDIADRCPPSWTTL